MTTSTSAAPTSTEVPAAEPPVAEEAVAEPVEEEVVSMPPVAEPVAGAESAAPPPAVTSEGGDRPRTERQLNPFNCVGEICPNPYPDAPAPDPNADPQNPQIVWCGTDKNVHDRGATVYNNGDWTPWSQHCADMFDAVNNPPNPPGTMGGGGAVAGPCHPDEEGMVTHTPDMRKQQCTGGHWVFIR